MREDSELIAEAAQGDMKAFESLIRRYEKRVYNTILRICGHPDDAFDLSQEVFLRVWRGLESFRGEAAFSTWLYRLCSNACMDFLRKRSRIKEEPLSVELKVSDGRYDPALSLEKKELMQSINTAMQKLSPDHRVILTLRELSGLSYAEIAAVLELDEGTVKSRIARARMRMREELDKKL